MARVCQDKYPAGFGGNRNPGFYLEDGLKAQLDILLKNITKDWDFTIIISASGEVRVGKSVLAMQIAAYWVHQLKQLYDIDVPLGEENFVFNGSELIKTGNRLGTEHPYSVLIFDEAGSDLEGTKVMKSSTQAVKDFYRECGQYNLLNILVIPEFFDLPRGIAISRSICLIDVSYNANSEGLLERGYFRFYSRLNKKKLYLKGKRDLDYNAHVYNFRGRFYNFYPIDEEEYRGAKQKALSRRGEALEKKPNERQRIQLAQRNASWYIMFKELGMTQVDIARKVAQLTGLKTEPRLVSESISAVMPIPENSPSVTA